MPSNSNAILRSIRRWLLVAVFLLGIAVIVLANTAYIVSDYTDGAVSAAAGVVGGSVALIAGVRLLGTLWTNE